MALKNNGVRGFYGTLSFKLSDRQADKADWHCFELCLCVCVSVQ